VEPDVRPLPFWESRTRVGRRDRHCWGLRWRRAPASLAARHPAAELAT